MGEASERFETRRVRPAAAQPPTDRTPENGPPIVALSHVVKRFPGVLAVDDVSLGLRAGEVHVVLGENGAGKSTIVGMLSGLQAPDEGEILIDGAPARLANPRRAIGFGVSTVFQHVMLAPTLTVQENLLLGQPWWQRPDIEDLEAELAGVRVRFGIDVDLDAVTGELSLGEQQQVEIARALLRHSRVLILDEATAMLTPKGAEELGAIMRRMVGRGISILFITHKLDEAYRFGDRISVLRLGRLVAEIAPERLRAMTADEARAEVVAAMFGRAEASERGGKPGGKGKAGKKKKGRAKQAKTPRLSVRGLSVEGDRRLARVVDVDFEIKAGEILGVAGIDGNGQSQLAQAIAGQLPLDTGVIALDGEDVTGLDIAARRKRGLRYLTDDRLGEGTVGAFPVSTNFVLKQIGDEPFWKWGLERSDRIRAHAKQLVRGYDVRTPSVETPIGRLSGGNIQKAILARELADGARVAVFSKPTYGLDVQNSQATRRRIREIAADGIGVLLISTDLDELLELADRIAVMVAGGIVGTVENGPDARERIGRLMIGEAA